MFKKLNTIKVFSKNHASFWFRIFDNHAYVVDRGYLFRLQEELQPLKQYPDTDLAMVMSSECLVIGNTRIGYDFLKKDHTITTVGDLRELDMAFDAASPKLYFFKRNKALREYRSGIYDTHTHEFLFTKETPPLLNISFIEGDVYLTVDQERIDGHGHVWWSLDQSAFEGAEFREYMGLWRNQIIIASNRHLLLAVDVSTGKVIRRWQELEGFQIGSYQNVLPEPSDFVLDKETGRLVGVFSRYYFEIDLDSGKVLYENIQAELESHGMSSFRRMGAKNELTKTHLFVSANMKCEGDVEPSAIVALNRHTRRIEWVHVFRDFAIGIHVPRLAGDHLYQIDVDNNIHIFARE